VRRLIILIFADWLPQDLSSSRSCLALASEVRRAPYSLDSSRILPKRGRVPAGALNVLYVVLFLPLLKATVSLEA